MISLRPFPLLAWTTLATLLIPALSCKQESSSTTEPLQAAIHLEELPSSTTGITFANQIKEEGMVNIFTWHFLYNGAGVAAGDINNDGLPDL